MLVSAGSEEEVLKPSGTHSSIFGPTRSELPYEVILCSLLLLLLLLAALIIAQKAVLK